MRFRTSLSCLAFVVVAAACGGRGSGEHADEEHGSEEGHDEESGEHEDEVQISADAARRAGIRVGAVERRALTGGTAIPAEVQFEPSSTAHVGPLAPGRFTKVVVTLGDRVQRGQLLGTVASGDAATARSRLGQSQAQLDAAEAALERQRQLSEAGIGAERALVEAQARVDELRAESAGVRQQLSVFGSGASGELQLKSPIDGVVVAIHATLGEAATPEQAAFVVTDPTRVWVQGNVPELEIANVSAGSAAIVRLHAFPDLAMRGTVAYVAPALEEQTRSLPIRVTLEAPDARLRSGLFGTIELIGGAADERVVAIPADAVATVQGQTVVFVPGDEPDSYRPEPVEIGRHAGGFLEVRSGLEEGDRIATTGAFTLKSALESSELSEGHAH